MIEEEMDRLLFLGLVAFVAGVCITWIVYGLIVKFRKKKANG